MAPISEKRATTQQQMSQQDVVIQASVPTTTMLKETGLGGGGSLSHGQHNHTHIHGHGHPHHYQQQQQHIFQPNHSHQPHHHHHHHHHHYHNNNSSKHHAKENSNGRNVVGGPGKGLEILDFHESWLEEMEVYKDMMHVKRLGSHNHVHQLQALTPAGMLDAPLPTGYRATGGAVAPTINSLTKGNEKRPVPTTEKKTRQRLTTSAGAEAAAVGVNDGGGGHHQSHKKRPREETPAKTAGGEKTIRVSSPSGRKRSGRSSNINPQVIGGPAPIAAASRQNAHAKPVSNVTTTAYNTYNNIAPSSASANSSSPPKHNLKIIVNQFHASSLLNGKQLVEKEQILTQNGLTNNSPASAYEASFYAANYLNPDGRNGNALRSSLAEPNNYVGVSLASNGHDVDSPEDDPSADIDDVNDYSDSDSDNEYAGEPFYLMEDGKETLQSKDIYYHSPEASKPTNPSDPDDGRREYYTPKSILSPSLFPNVPPYLNYSSHSRMGPSMPQQLHKVLKWKLSPVMPKIVKRVVLNSGFRIIKNTMDWMAVWEKHMKSPGFRTIRSHQKYNHMPGSFRIGRKDSMWRSIHSYMKKYGKKEFGFMQRSYIMPDDLEDLRLAWPKNASRLTKWIVKPPASARGTGISIVNKWSQFPKDRPLVVQKYIEKPLLINDNKFDMRIYVVMTSINPMRIYMYKDGLARFASVKYSSELNSLDERCMHLTNYSINKFSENYAKNEDFNACQGHKWTLQSLWSCLEERGVNTKRLWATLRNLVIRALVSGEAGVNRMYRQNVNFRYNCFELFGFDVLLDENLVPWLLEINISPSLHSELPLDLHVKGPLIQAVLNTALYQVPPKLTEKQQLDILDDLNLHGPLCHDKRIFTTCLRPDEIRKHNQFTNRSIEFREEYLDAILEHLNPDDVRCLLVSEDELNRCSPLERVFPTPDTHKYLKFVEYPRYYNRLLDAWEYRYGHCRQKGIKLLREYCKDNYHLQVPETTVEKEPTGNLTEIDLLHVKKDDSSLVTTDVADATKTSPSVKTIASGSDIAPDDTANLPSSSSLNLAGDIKTSITTITAANTSDTDMKTNKTGPSEEKLKTNNSSPPSKSPTRQKKNKLHQNNSTNANDSTSQAIKLMNKTKLTAGL